MGSVTVNLFLDKRASKDGEGIVKWLVSFEGKQRLFTTGLRLSEDDWAFLKKHKSGLPGQVKNDSRRRLWNMLFGSFYHEEYTGKETPGYLSKAQTIIGTLGEDFSFERFAYFIGGHGSPEKKPESTKDANDIIVALKSKASRMEKDGRIGNASNYLSTASSLLRFIKSLSNAQWKELFDRVPTARKTVDREDNAIYFKDVTPAFLTRYEKWMLQSGSAPRSVDGNATPASLTTVGIYCRHMRSIYNDAVEQGIIDRASYPFGKNRYVIPAGSNTKKALKKEDILKLMAYQPSPGMEQRSLDLWLFSYLCNGMNMNDICRIKWEDIEDDRLSFVRQKTARTRKSNQTRIKVSLFPQSQAIINRWSDKDQKAKNYVFPFLNEGMTPDRQGRVIKQVIKVTNQHMRKIADTLGIQGNVNTYSARHSFATILLQSEAPLAFISQALGHTSISTTESYLGSFDDEKTKKYLSALL